MAIKNLKYWLFSVFMIFLVSCQAHSDEISVLRVIDGDTILVAISNREERVRFIGIDTPESVHPDALRNSEAGKLASEYLKSRVGNRKVKLEFDVQERDHYGRLLAYVYLDDKMLNEELLEKGYAVTNTVPPNVKYQKHFSTLQKNAQQNNVGFWKEMGPLEELFIDKDGKGLIKGNINKDRKIYHMPGQENYDRTKIETEKGERWFKTEREALEAGFEKAHH